MPDVLFAYDVHTHLTAFLLGSARLLAFAMLAPFMGSQVIGLSVRSSVIMALYLVIHPMMLEVVATTEMSTLTVGLLIVKELFIGFVLGWLSGMVFWAVEGAGFFIDNQRGAGQASQNDPLTGDQSSPTGSFLLQSTFYVFFASGAFVALLALVYSTYEFWPPSQFLPLDFFRKEGAALFFGACLAKLALNIVLISAPVVLACLFTDVSLGLINRFASQLNVYVLAMPIKSAMVSFLLIFYFAVLMTDAAQRFSIFGVDLSQLRVWLR